MSTSPLEEPNLNKRWTMLWLASLAQLAMALNWFNISPALPGISKDLSFGVQGEGAVVSAFVLAFALLHVPGGIIGARIGIRSTLVLGSVVQAIGTFLAGLAPNLTLLILARIIAGAGASVITVVAIGAMSAWFHKREITLAMSMITGVAFTGGIAISYYVWTYVQHAFSWTGSSLIAGGLQLVVAGLVWTFYRNPRGYHGLEGTARLDVPAIWKACRNRHVVIYGVGFMGTYGAYITVSQLLVPYAISERGFDAASGGLLGGTLALIGIPICVVGGWLADKTGKVRMILGWGTGLVALSAFIIPLNGSAFLWLGGIGATIFLLIAFPAWTAVPAAVGRVPFDMVASAAGVMFTLSGVGGFVMPLLYGTIAGSAGHSVAWMALGVITFVLGLLVTFGGNPEKNTLSGAAESEVAEPSASAR